MELRPHQLRWECPKIKTNSRKNRDITYAVQTRAREAIRFGLENDLEGFNIFVAGIEGVGKKWLVMKEAEELARKLPVPNDWCYLHNFKDPKSPKAVSLPPGKAREFQEDMKAFVEHLKEELPKAFESKEYEEKAKEITDRYNLKKDEILRQLTKMAEIAGFTVKITPAGIALFPLMGGQLVPEEKLLADPRLREFVNGKRREIDPLVSDYMKKIRDLDKQQFKELRKLREEVALFVINTFVEDLQEKYIELPQIREHILEVKEDILKNIDMFTQLSSAGENPFLTLQIERNLAKYDVNVVVDNSQLEHAPLVYEKNPTYSNLFGKIGVKAEFGLYVTDFTQIVPGSIHRANGGILVLRVKDILMNPGVWHTLKKVLLYKEITVQPYLEELGIAPPITSLFKPQPIPLNLKVVLLGDPLMFYLLGILDPEFGRLFKVKAEFQHTVDNIPENRRLLASTISELTHSNRLLPLTSGALAALTEYSVRLSGNRNKLSLKIEKLLDVVREAHFIAKKKGHERIERRHIEQALETKEFRSNLIEERILELIKDGTIIVEPEGEKIGQVYGLSVTELEDYIFGKPVRITATSFCGNRGIISIERETKLSGKIFEKALLTLSGYIGNTYGKKQPISLSAYIAFEQSYSLIEGDSATLAELIALLSSIGNVPVRQNIALTGSVDQLGNVQPVGGVNEKVEGFWKVCKLLNVKGGVVIPSRNMDNLQLKKDVVSSVKKGDFCIYAVSTVDEAIEIMSSMKAEDFHCKVRESLHELHKHSVKEKGDGGSH